MKSLFDTITNDINLETNVKNISVIDEIKYELNFEKIINILKTYNPNNEIEVYIKTHFSNEEIYTNNILSCNYFNNFFVSTYFILGNCFTIDLPIFDIIYENYLLLDKIPEILINKYNKIITDKNFHLFYNYEIINRWYKTIICQPINKNDYFKISKLSNRNKNLKWDKYIIIWKKFNDNCLIFKKYLRQLLQFYKPLKIKIVGCYSINKKYYEHCLESHLGIKINIDKLLKWGHEELNILVEKMKTYIKIAIPNINTNLSYKNLIKKIKDYPSQRFKSKNELIKFYKLIINKYEQFYIKENKFPEFIKPNLVIFSNSKMGGGYYTSNNFYLNTYNWKEMRKFTVESLVLHETIPGHHTQVSTMLNIKYKYPILFYFQSILNGFIEGWGLWSEKLGYDQTIWDKIGQVEYEIFRTLRIIVDINIHYYGKTPRDMLLYMKEYMVLSKSEINNEIYRYVCQPGQAVSYKVGSYIFQKIIENENIDNLLDTKLLTIYKKIILDGPLPLQFLIKKYKIKNLFF